MGIKLIVEVLDHSPADLTDKERLLLLSIAENANDDTRCGWPGRELLMRRTHATEWDTVGKLLRGLARKGLEVRVPVTGKRGAHGGPLFAARGHQTTYRLPELERSANFADQTGEKGLRILRERSADFADPSPQSPHSSPSRSPEATALPNDWCPNAQHKQAMQEAQLDPAETADAFGEWCRSTGERRRDWDRTFGATIKAHNDGRLAEDFAGLSYDWGAPVGA